LNYILISFYIDNNIFRKNNYIELDIYPFWSNYAIVEVEVTNENQEISLPEMFRVVKEVTFDSKFKNNHLLSHQIEDQGRIRNNPIERPDLNIIRNNIKFG